MKNIAIFCHDYKKSGANLSLIDWLTDMDFDKYNIYIFVPRYDKEFYDSLLKIGIKNIIVTHYMLTLKKLYETDFKNKLKDFIKNIYSFLFNKLFYCCTKSKIKKFNIDIIHSNSFAVSYGAKLAYELDLPHVWHIREFMEEDHKITHINQQEIYKLANNSNAIFISDVIAEKYRKIYDFKTANIIYNKINYDNSYIKKRKYFEDSICNIIIVGTLQENKGHMDAIRLIEKNNKEKKFNLRLFIAGDGPYKNKLIKYVNDNNIENIEFLGYRNDITDLRKKMDIALMCSYNEALGRVTIEAQYYENLIIGANSGCTKYLIKDGENGFLYTKNNIDELYNIISKSLMNKKGTEIIIKNAKNDAIKNFNNSITKNIIEIYSNII